MKTLTKLFTYVPISCLTLILSYWLRAIYILGRLPFYSNPDPKDLEMWFHFDLLIISIFLLPCSIIVVALNVKKLGKFQLGLFFIPLLLLALMLLTDPLDIVDWLAD